MKAAGLLLAVYSGERRGGTAATMRYARKLGLEHEKYVTSLINNTYTAARTYAPP